MNHGRSILVHACCASCSCYVFPHLAATYDVTAYFYNPNIHPEREYLLRLDEMRRIAGRCGVRLIEGDYRTLRWWKEIWRYRHLPERSERCFACYRHRFEVSARKAAELGIPLFTSTLSVSPHKVFDRIAAIGAEAGLAYGAAFLAEDFKKRDGFRKSVEGAREHGLTRQDYCGCLMSLEEANLRRAARGGCPGGITRRRR
jgi:predicted adenine nucleotide alpha hydrolase (AANH) superfamily ATPase